MVRVAQFSNRHRGVISGWISNGQTTDINNSEGCPVLPFSVPGYLRTSWDTWDIPGRPEGSSTYRSQDSKYPRDTQEIPGRPEGGSAYIESQDIY